MELDALFLSRLQFGLTIGFHYLFPPLSIGLSWLMVLMKGMYIKTRDKQYETLSGDMVRSKEEVIVANILHQSGIPFTYEEPLHNPDGPPKAPDFTISWRDKTYYWEHLGMLDVADYAEEWAVKKAWYEAHYPGQLITTEGAATLSQQTKIIIAERFGVQPVEAEP